MSPPTRENSPHLGAGSGMVPPPTAVGRADRPPPTAAPPAQEHQWPPTPDAGARPHVQPPACPAAVLDLAGSSTSALAMLAEVLTVREAAPSCGRPQPALPGDRRGELGAVHIGRSIRIPKQALLDLLAASLPPASGSE